MRRYYLSTVVGSGTRADMFRAKAGDLAEAAGGNCTAVIPSGAVAGDRCLVIVDCRDHTGLLTDADLQALPDLTLDAQLNTLTTQTRTAILTYCTNHGIDVSAIKATDAFRVLVRAIGRHYESAFTENAFDVAPAA